ncbi:alpha/beta hydrolase [Paenibacillus lemnae]|uniref:Alpha/beta hydrolase n=1 Tax=Paenibacillus lemnae TaxID=1330551 RepID=A0A848M7G3_PAELE|nr:alpha/beta hydrolase [Paenibacillus lemnae]NMO96576.1 alpha/beta hydrolase [Paenibacillus lemnae]
MNKSVTTDPNTRFTDPKFKVGSLSIPMLPDDNIEHISNKYLDIPYAAQSPSQQLDIYLPPHGVKPYPVLIYFHGGGFVAGDKRDVNIEPMLRALEKGYALVSVGYRKSKEAKFPALIYDAKAAVRFIRAHAAAYDLDPGAIASIGPSAGGWISGMLGVTGGNPAFEDLSMGNAEISSEVQAAVTWCAPTGNFLDMDPALAKRGLSNEKFNHNDPYSPESWILGAAITDIPELVRLADPCTYAHPNIPPFLIQHGTADSIVPVDQSLVFAEALMNKAGKDRVMLEIGEGKEHHHDPWYLTDLERTDMVFRFLDRVFQK